MDKPVMILGAGSLGKSAKEAFESNNVLVYGFMDDDTSLQDKEFGDVSVVSKLDDESFLSIIGSECDVFVALEETELRRNLVQMLIEERKVMPVNAVHETAVFATSSGIGHGNYIGAGVIIGSHSSLMNHLIVNPAAVINHDVIIGNYVQIGSGSVINSGVEINDNVFIGSGVILVSGVKIGEGARIGAGSVVIKNIEAGETVFGNPAEVV
jgi:sugar O-acyltransferase (sialic acid O-acetyltransferase NeuD family)